MKTNVNHCENSPSFILFMVDVYVEFGWFTIKNINIASNMCGLIFGCLDMVYHVFVPN